MGAATAPGKGSVRSCAHPRRRNTNSRSGPAPHAGLRHDSSATTKSPTLDPRLRTNESRSQPIPHLALAAKIPVCTMFQSFLTNFSPAIAYPPSGHEGVAGCLLQGHHATSLGAYRIARVRAGQKFKWPQGSADVSYAVMDACARCGRYPTGPGYNVNRVRCKPGRHVAKSATAKPQLPRARTFLDWVHVHVSYRAVILHTTPTCPPRTLSFSLSSASSQGLQLRLS